MFRIAEGDARAFARWVALHEVRLRLSLRSFAAQVDVEAIVQETLLRIWQVALRVEPHPKGQTLMRLAVRIARNLAIDSLRRRRLTPTEPAALERAIEAQDDLPFEQLGAPDPVLRNTIAGCRDKLPGKPKQALAARIESRGRAHDSELAATLGMRLNTFAQNVSRARKLLARCLERQGVRVLAGIGGAR